MVFISLLPLIRNDFWVFRVFEFPRAQKWVINFILLIASILFFSSDAYFSFGFIILLLANQLYLSYQVYPYLPIAKKQIESVSLDFEPSIKLLIANVYQENREWMTLSSMIEREQADVVLLLETNKWWKEKCNSFLSTDYAYQVIEDRENTYGMLLYSKLQLTNTKIHYLVKNEVPSIETDIKLGKRLIKFFAIHPEPPVPSENPKSTARDAEILLVEQKTKADKIPTIVAGDLNDVAWSYTTELFLKISGLLDPRRGRGFFSSFHAQYPFARWPLDHVFCSGHFRLQSMRRLEGIGSDHFPISLQLYLAKTNDDSDELQVSKKEEILANEKIEKEIE